MLETPNGTNKVRVGSGTTIRRESGDGSRALGFRDLSAGDLVTVDGDSGTPEGAEARDIEVIDAGEDGFNITPGAKQGARTALLFP